MRKCPCLYIKTKQKTDHTRKLQINLIPKHFGKNIGQDHSKKNQPNIKRGKAHQGRIIWIRKKQSHRITTGENNRYNHNKL